MKKNLICAFVVGLLTMCCGLGAKAEKPSFLVHAKSDGTIFTQITDNGEWGLTQPATEEASGGTTIYNFNTNKKINFKVSGFSASCISEDGNIVYGNHGLKAAYYDRTTEKITDLEMPTMNAPAGNSIVNVTCELAMISAVSADGKWAVGTGRQTSASDCMVECGVLWDLSTGKVVALNNVPTLDMCHEDTFQCRFVDINDNGRYILGILSFSYIMPAQCCCFLYDTQTQSAEFIGFTPSDTEAWTPKAPNLFFVGGGKMSPDGTWITGAAYITAAGEFEATYLYNTQTKEFVVYSDQNQDANMVGMAVDNNGVVYAATPSDNPIREWYVRNNGYWYSFAQILTQAFGTTFKAETGLENTGTPMGVSADGSRFVLMCDPQFGENYFVDMHQPIVNLCQSINLLGNYSIEPKSGSVFTKLREFLISFDRDVQVVGSASDILLKDENGKLVRSASAVQVKAGEKQAVLVSFRTTPLDAGKKYTVEVPAGIVALANDATKTNDAITLTYTGRADKALEVTKIYPAAGTSLQMIDYGTSPVLITFDSPLKVAENAAARLINKADNSLVCHLNFAYLDNQIAVFPATEQNLFLDNEYQVIVEAGAVTDVAGYGANEEIVIDYKGSYVRPISSDDENIFIEDFSDLASSLVSLMRYEGDHNEPCEEMASWEFDADNQPWNFSLRDDDGTDFCAASHSMYQPAGKSDDWMVTPQLFITDESVTLSFDAQSYRRSKQDRLKVYVWACDAKYNSLSASIIEDLRANATLEFDELLSPGKSENVLLGDWTNYTVSLEKYAGKSVYIAFLNDNEDQSVVFVDNIKVSRSMKFLLSIATDDKVVMQESVTVKGILTANSDNDTFSSLSLALLDYKGTEIDKISADGLSLAKGDRYEFTFAKPLPLTMGEEVKYSIAVTLDELKDVVSSTVKNLAFRPTKRVVLEEFTGVTCVNCPQGILAIERLEEAYGSQFIPISIHTYSNDPLSPGLGDYSDVLGLYAAPSGIVNRNGEISYPMWTNTSTKKAEFSNGIDLWADQVAKEMNKPAEADLEVAVEVNENNNTFNVPMTVKYALNANHLNLNVFVVLMEDGVVSIQQNTFASNADPAFGEWGKGGKYGQAVVTNYAHNDVARMVYGNLPNGTGGYWTNSMVAGYEYTNTMLGLEIPESVSDRNRAKVCVMLIDANTGSIVNSAVAYFNPEYNSVEAIEGESQIDIQAINGTVVVNSAADANVEVYNAAGALIARGSGNGAFTVNTNGHKGLMLVKATAGNEVKTQKVVIR